MTTEKNMKKNNKNLILVGMMGSGKTSIANYLAENFSFELIDTDNLIEQAENKTISEIFETHGENFFRDIETKTLEKISENINKNNLNKKFVISTGGGLILREKNREILKNLGLIIFLDASPEELFSRLNNKNNIINRPLLPDSEEKILLEKIKNIYSQRISLYREISDLIIKTENFNLSNITLNIINSVEKLIK